MNFKYTSIDFGFLGLITDPNHEKNMQLRKLAVLASVGAMFALMMLPTAMATPYSGSLQCVSGCASGNTIPLTGPGSTGSATFEFYASNAPSGTTMHYYVCPVGSGCSSNAGTDNGWSWTFTPASGTVSTCPSGTCEGASYGSPSTMTLSLTAPTTVTPTNGQETLTIYACSQTGTEVKCGGSYTEVASLTVTATVPQFAVVGTGLAVVLGAVGLLFLKKKSLPQIVPTVGTAV